MRKHFKTFLSVLLAVLMVVLPLAQITAKAGTTQYVEDIVIVAAESIKDAQKAAGDGYTVMKTPIYDGSSDKGNNARTKMSYLCYKTTTDPRKAITEIKALNMNAPWDYDTYNKYIEDFKANIKKDVQSLSKSIMEFQNNYYTNSDTISYPKSVYAYNVLQYLYDDDILESKDKDLKECYRLGDLFLNLDFEDDDSRVEAENILCNILLESNAQCVNIIYNALTLACSETDETSFLDIISAPNFNANIYKNVDTFNDYAQDIIDTIYETQREIKKYETYGKLDESIFTVPAELSDVYSKLRGIIDFDNAQTLKFFDQYIKTVKKTDSASASPAERRLLIEETLCDFTWYNLDNEEYMAYLKETSFNNIYWMFDRFLDMVSQGNPTVDNYYSRIRNKKVLYENKAITIPKEFEDLLKLYENDQKCWDDYAFDRAEILTGETVSNILKSCKYRGYEVNGEYEYTNLYELVMLHDVTAEEAPEKTYKPSDFYPIIAQLTDGQRGMLKTGILNLVLSVVVEAEAYEKSFEEIKKIIKDLAEGECKVEGVDPDDPCYSIYAGIDRGLFEEKSGVAMMQSAVDFATQEKPLDLEKERNRISQLFKNMMIGFGVVAGVAGLGAIVAVIIVNQVYPRMINAATQAIYDSLQPVWQIAGAASKVLGIVAAVIALVMGVITLWYELNAIWKDPEPTKYREIPRVICNAEQVTTYYMNLDGNWTENYETGYVYYYGVKNPDLDEYEKDDTGNSIGKNKVADVANWSQSQTRQWIALYTTKSETAGKPILSSSLEISGQSYVYGKRTVSMFSNGTSCDMQQYLKNSPDHKYLLYAMDTSYKPYQNIDPVDVNGAASVFAKSTTFAVGGIGLLLGIAGGCGITAIANKNKKKREESEIA